MRSLINELRRRNVLKVAAAYLVAAWVLLQVADLLVPVLTLPDWTTRLVFLLLLIGFFPALILSWAYEMSPSGVSRDPADVESRESTGFSPALVALVVFGIAAVGSAIYWYAGRDVRWASNVALPEIVRLTEAGDWESAYRVAREVDQRLPDSEILNDVWPSIGFVTTIESTPPGARVSRRAYGSEEDGEDLGLTPIYDVMIPFGPSIVTLEIEGRPPIERIIGGETNGSIRLNVRDSPQTRGAQIPPGAFVLDTEDSLPAGMVRVPGTTIRVGSDEMQMSDFYIGRYEVTNQEFKQFVDAGGYRNPVFWEHDIVADGRTLDFDEAMTLFVDQSGRHGPATWVAGDFPDGGENLPVAGVSWYEAAAYARFAGRQLPTLHHWKRAHASGMLSWQLQYSNLESDRLEPVGTRAGIGWTGTYDMVGNAREWCYNAVGDQRVIVGGSYDGLAYAVQHTVDDPFSLPALDRSPSNGIRLAFTTDPEQIVAQFKEPVVPSNIPVLDDPVPDAVFRAFLGRFDYDRRPLDPREVEVVESRHWTRYRISITSSEEAGTLPLYLYLPAAPRTRYQAVIYWPSILGLVRDSVDEATVHLDFVLRNGRAVVLPVFDGTFERRRNTFPDWSTNAGTNIVIQAMKDMRRTIDYLESRPDIDGNSIGFYGLSWGGRLGAIALAIEPRLKAGILNQAGLQHLQVPETNVINYLPRVKTPVLQFNGRYDADFRFETSALPYFELLTALDAVDKKHVVEDTGHFVPRHRVIGETLDWLDKYLGPVN